MDCPDCGAETLAFPVSPEFQPLLPGETSDSALCTRCLALHPADQSPAEPPDFQQVSDAFPPDDAAAVPMVLVVGLVENLALYRAEISDLLERVERAGTDPLLVLDRLARDPDLDPTVDLGGRRRQLEQLL